MCNSFNLVSLKNLPNSEIIVHPVYDSNDDAPVRAKKDAAAQEKALKVRGSQDYILHQILSKSPDWRDWNWPKCKVWKKQCQMEEDEVMDL